MISSCLSFISEYCFFDIRVRNIADKHGAGGVRDDDGKLCVLQSHLRRNAAGPEQRDLTCFDPRYPAPVGLAQINADFCGIVVIDRRSVYVRKSPVTS